MIMHKGECILCQNREETRELCNLLYEHGYRMFSEHFDIRRIWEDSNNWYGLRWSNEYKFPYCIVATSIDQVERILEGCLVQGTTYNYEWYKDFASRRCRYNIEVGDLL